MWEGATGKLLEEVSFEQEHTLSLMDAKWVDAEHFITASNDGTLKLWHKEGGASKK